jgi:hypothetical protein
VVVHENRGLNPHTKDVARRLAVDGFQALAVDFLSPIGGTPSDQDKAREMIGTLQAPDVTGWAQGAVAYLRSTPNSNGKVGAVGFCWGGGVIGRLAVAEPTLVAAVYYGQQPPAEEVVKIRRHAAELCRRRWPINAGITFQDAEEAARTTPSTFMTAHSTLPQRHQRALQQGGGGPGLGPDAGILQEAPGDLAPGDPGPHPARDLRSTGLRRVSRSNHETAFRGASPQMKLSGFMMFGL